VEPDAAGSGPVMRLRADLEPGGQALTHVLEGLLRRGALIVSCTRRDASLQEVFDLTVGEPDREPESEPEAVP